MASPEISIHRAVTDGKSSLSSEDQLELERQKNLFQGSFTYICDELEVRVKILRLAIVAELRNMADEIRGGKKTIEAFWTYQEEHIDDPAYEFLGKIHPGLNVAGWRVFMALIDPLAYGRDVKAMSGPYTPMSKP